MVGWATVGDRRLTGQCSGAAQWATAVGAAEALLE